MKIAVLYSGRSLSQPVLLNHLHEKCPFELHLFRDNEKEDVELNFDHEKNARNINGVRIGSTQPLWFNQYIIQKKWGQYLLEKLDSGFDLVIGMNDLGPPSIQIADYYDIPSLFFIRNLACSGQEMYKPNESHIRNIRRADFGATIQYPFLINNFKQYKLGLQKATKPIANSKYVATRLEQDFKVSPEIIYPPISPDKYSVKYDPHGSIGMVGPRSVEKGADIFLDIVEAMPDENFISAGIFRDNRLKNRANNLDNLTHMGYVDDMRNFYKQTKLVVVPSRLNEAFGRAAAEPMVSGIPCVVSNRGGLPEVVGDTGEIVSDIESTSNWIKAIDRALNNNDPYAQFNHVQKFSTENQVNVLHNIIKSTI